jgi:hypothetical protein
VPLSSRNECVFNRKGFFHDLLFKLADKPLQQGHCPIRYSFGKFEVEHEIFAFLFARLGIDRVGQLIPIRKIVPLLEKITKIDMPLLPQRDTLNLLDFKDKPLKESTNTPAFLDQQQSFLSSSDNPNQPIISLYLCVLEGRCEQVTVDCPDCLLVH